MKRMRRGAFPKVGCWSVATTVTVLVAATVIVCSWKLFRSPRVPVAWSGYQTICETDGRKLTCWQLRARNGSFIHDARTRFCLGPSFLAYWSDKDRSLCIVSRDGTVHWFDLRRFIQKGEWVSALSCSGGDTVLINLRKWHPKGAALPAGCILFDTNARSARRLADVLMAVGRDNNMVLVSRTGQVTVRAAGVVRKTNLILPVDQPSLVFDIDSDSKYIFVYPAENSHKIARYSIHGGQVRLCWISVAPWIGPVDGLQWIPEQKEIWCSCSLPFSSGFIVVSYDDEGHFTANRLQHRWPVNTPFVVGERNIVRLRTLLQLGAAQPSVER